MGRAGKNEDLALHSTKSLKIYRKSVLHLLKYRLALYSFNQGITGDFRITSIPISNALRCSKIENFIFAISLLRKKRKCKRY